MQHEYTIFDTKNGFAAGKIGGFSAPGGPSAKAKMLEIEGVPLADLKTRATDNKKREQTSFGF